MKPSRWIVLPKNQLCLQVRHLPLFSSFVRFVVLLGIMCFGLAVRAQVQLDFQHIGLQAGMPDGHVRRTMMDSRGFLWIGTFQGLVRYDGTTFKHYEHEPERPNSLSHHEVLSLAEAPDGRIWIGTSEGLNVLDQRSGTIRHYLHMPADSSQSLSHNTITDLLFTSDTSLWIATNGGGLNCLNPLTGAITAYRHDPQNPESLRHDYLLSLFPATDGLWIGQGGAGLSHFNAATGVFTNYYFQQETYDDTFKANVVRKVFQAADGTLWLAAYRGLHRFHPQTRSYRYYAHEPGNPQSLADNSLTCLLAAPHGGFWIGTYYGGLHYFDPKQESFAPIEIAGTNKPGILSLSEGGGCLWVGTTTMGLYKAVEPEALFQRISQNLKAKPTDKIRLFLDGPEGQSWALLQSRGLVSLATQAAPAPRLGYQDALEKLLYSEVVSACSWDRQGNLWIGTRKNGLFYLDTLTQTWQQFLAGSKNGELSHSHISSLLLDRSGKLWVGTAAGLNRYNPETHTFEVQHTQTHPEIPTNAVILSLLEDRQGRLWIGTENGLFCKPSHDIARAPSEQAPYGLLSKQAILSLAEDDRDRLWIGTRNGLYLLHPDTAGRNDLQRFMAPQSLMPKRFNRLAFAPNGQLWAATEKGLAQADPERGWLATYPLAGSGERPGLSFVKMSEVMFASNYEELLWFDPDHIPTPTEAPAVYLTELRVFNQPVNPGHVESPAYFPQLTEHISFTESLEIPYSARMIGLSFTALDFRYPENTRFAYQLEGFDQDWVHLDKVRQATFTNLAPGNYRFRLKATNAYGVWSEGQTYLHIHIRPPFWQRWWFMGLVVTLLGSLAYVLHRYRLEKALAVERVRVRIARDLHDDIGATLTKISLYADLANSGNESHPQKALLEKIANMGRDTLKSFGDVVWAIDARNDTLGSLINKVQDHAQELFQQKDMGIAFQETGIDPNVPLKSEKRQHLYLICKEALNNVVKHSNATEASVTFRLEHNKLGVVITDNGQVKQPVTPRKLGSGFSNMQSRADALGASLELKNGRGFSVVLKNVQL